MISTFSNDFKLLFFKLDQSHLYKLAVSFLLTILSGNSPLISVEFR